MPIRENNKESDRLEGKNYLRGKEGNNYQNGCPSHSYLHYGNFQDPKSLMRHAKLYTSQVLVGQTKDEKKILWINWKKLCSTKGRGVIGFRDIQAFNLALLTKQAWRLFHNTHSLFFQVYKSVFSKLFFMDAELGSNPSYVWRSLLAAREIICEGSKWEVGDGRTICVTTRKWLSHKPIFMGEQQPDLKVKDLIDSDIRQWDREKIFDLLAHRTSMEIMSMPLPRTNTRDVLIWKENKSQSFTVKSAYQVALTMKEITHIEHSTARTEWDLWRKLWRLNVPPKVRMFLWRACSNVLPTRENLHRRRVQVDPLL